MSYNSLSHDGICYDISQLTKEPTAEKAEKIRFDRSNSIVHFWMYCEICTYAIPILRDVRMECFAELKEVRIERQKTH